MIANTLLPARSQVSTDDELDGDIIENPAALRLGEVYIAAGEHEVPLTPTTCASATTASPAARLPTGQHLSSRVSIAKRCRCA